MKLNKHLMRIPHVLLIYFMIFVACTGQQGQSMKQLDKAIEPNVVVPGAERMMKYIPSLEGKRVAMVVNHTSRVAGKHLIDTLQQFDLNIVKVFAPEHGFRGKADAGAIIKDGVDVKSGIPVKSLYGKSKKPSPADLKDVDVVVFDIQDVGCRFYTYISTMTLVMEACAEQQIPVIVLDRPNPNGHYVDGPVLDPKFSSFVGMHPVPVVYGMTIGEYAKMVNGEAWMKQGVQCELTVIPCLKYTREWSENLAVRPSPNLPNHRSVLLYPSLCFFEGTVVSVGRGTSAPFQQIGHPTYSNQTYSFIPKTGPGSKYPKLENKRCYGTDFQGLNPRFVKTQNQLDLSHLINFYKDLNLGEAFFLKNKFIDKLAGTDQLRKQLLAGLGEEEIRFSWQADLEHFKKIRLKYLMYD